MAGKRIKPKVVEIVNYFADRLQKNGVSVAKIVVFGSHIKGTADRDSDLDLIIVSDNFRRKNLFKRAEMIGKAYDETITKYMVPMDIIMESPEEFNPEFGIIVYAA